MHSSLILLQAGSGTGMANLIFLGLIFVVFYFFLIRPQTKKQKSQNKFVEALEKGDEVVTSSGILGRVKAIEGDIITLEIGTKMFVRITKNAISKELTDAVFASNEKAK